MFTVRVQRRNFRDNYCTVKPKYLMIIKGILKIECEWFLFAGRRTCQIMIWVLYVLSELIYTGERPNITNDIFSKRRIGCVFL